MYSVSQPFAFHEHIPMSSPSRHYVNEPGETEDSLCRLEVAEPLSVALNVQQTANSVP